MLLSDFIQLLTPISIVCGIIFAYFQFRRNQRHDDKKDTETSTIVLVKLENIMSSLSDVKSEITLIKSDFKSEINDIKADYRSDHDRIIILERDKKTLFNKFDELYSNDRKNVRSEPYA